MNGAVLNNRRMVVQFAVERVVSSINHAILLSSSCCVDKNTPVFHVKIVFALRRLVLFLVSYIFCWSNEDKCVSGGGGSML